MGEQSALISEAELRMPVCICGRDDCRVAVAEFAKSSLAKKCKADGCWASSAPCECLISAVVRDQTCRSAIGVSIAACGLPSVTRCIKNNPSSSICCEVKFVLCTIYLTCSNT